MPESASGGVLVRGVSAPGGVWSRRGVCLVQGGLLPGGSSALGGLPQCLLGYHHPPPSEQNDKQMQKYYLGHNFVAAGNYSSNH